MDPTFGISRGWAFPHGRDFSSSCQRRLASSSSSVLILLAGAFARPSAERVTFWHCQKVTKKARHESAVHRPLCFSLAPPSRQHVRVLALGDRDPSRSPHPFGLGLFRHELRCSAPRTVPLIHEYVHPWTTLFLAWARRKRATGAPAVRRGCREKARRVGAMDRAQFDVSTRRCCQRTSGSSIAKSEGRLPGDSFAGV